MNWTDKVKITRSNDTEEVMSWQDLTLLAEEGVFEGLNDSVGTPGAVGGMTLRNDREWVRIERVIPEAVAG